jgi:rhamnose transport system ATP-binding protein
MSSAEAVQAFARGRSGYVAVDTSDTVCFDCFRSKSEEGEVERPRHATSWRGSGRGEAVSEPAAPIVELRGATKSYGAVRALRAADLTLRPGEVRALIGENGAGKSTLVKVLGGVVRRDAGDMLVDGAPVDFHSPHDARDAGIAVIYQEPTLFGDLSIAENVVMGYHPLGALRRIDRRAMHRRVGDLLDRLGVRLDPERPVRGISIADQQIVEIAKALSLDARVLIMDEPTAALSGAEVERLFAVVRTLREHGAGVLFISHRLEEVTAIADTVTVMRDGAVVHDAPIADIGPDEMVRRMVGRDLSTLFPKQAAEIGAPVLAVERLTREGVFFDVSFSVRAGEIVALAGLVGAGRSEVARAVFGIDRADAGHVEVAGRRLPPGRPLRAMRAGIGFVPEDRRQQGLVMDLSVARNATITRMGSLARLGLIRGADEDRLALEWATRLQLKFHRLRDPVDVLSGGNQQKVVLAKWLATEPKVLIVDEPTRGIDVGTKSEVHRLLSELAGRGVAVLMISSELPEVLGMADRVLVMHEGRLVRELSREEADEESVIRAATGQADVAA